MNTSNNRRRRESVERIERAFMDMVQTRTLREITVAELCKRCGLNRSTFYANFTDIYDLADRVRERLYSEVNELYKREHTEHYNSYDFLKLFRHIRENQMLYRTCFALGYERAQELELFDTALAAACFDGRHIDYHIEFFRAGFNGIVKKWLAEGCRESPEEIDEIIRSEYRGRVSGLLPEG